MRKEFYKETDEENLIIKISNISANFESKCATKSKKMQPVTISLKKIMTGVRSHKNSITNHGEKNNIKFIITSENFSKTL